MMGILSFGKSLLNKFPFLHRFCSFVYTRIIGRNHFKIKGKDNRIELPLAFLKRCRIKIIGSNNRIAIGDKCLLEGCRFSINGSNNTICLDKLIYAKDVEFCIEDNANTIHIGTKTSLCGFAHLACIEGTNISVGENCLFSSDITFRTGDSHSILDKEGKRINPSSDIVVGNHVWIGSRVILTKGSEIGPDSVIATGAVVTKRFSQPNVILVGVPAGIIKADINWEHKRI